MYIMGCNAPKKSFDSIEPNILLANTDSLMKAYPDNTELVSAIVDARLMLAENDFDQYKKILIIE